VNFGTILNSVTKNCVKLMIESKDYESKSLTRDFINYVQIKEILNKQFKVYNQLNTSYIADKESAKIFVMETLSILDGFDFEDILSYNHLLETRFAVNKIKSTPINLEISKLIKYRTLSENKNQLEFITALNTIVEHVSTIHDEDNLLGGLTERCANSELKFLQPKHVVKIALNRFNEKYSTKFNRDDVFVFTTLKENDETKVKKLWTDKIEEIKTLQKELSNNIGEELTKKISDATNKIKIEFSQDNLLNAHELVSELKTLKEEL